VLQGLQLTDPHLGRFANNLALAVDHPVQINAYLTPAGTKGLELHFDFHDVFVVQLDGEKRWRVWAPLARTERPVRDGARPSMPTWDEVGEPLLDVTLEAGDCLYLPRGFPHAAEALASSSSHLTVGVMARTWQQAARHALDAALADPELRNAIPLGALGPDGPAAPDLQAVRDALDPARTRAWLAAETWRRQPSTRRRPLMAPAVSITDPVDVTPGALVWLTDATPGRITLGLGDRSLDLPDEAFELLAALLEHPAGFVAGDCRVDLDAESRQVVLDRLAAEGLVVPSAGVVS
jgi:lysine-specific demethylase/histidyl-hydroxylase NO66